MDISHLLWCIFYVFAAGFIEHLHKDLWPRLHTQNNKTIVVMWSHKTLDAGEGFILRSINLWIVNLILDNTLGSTILYIWKEKLRQMLLRRTENKQQSVCFIRPFFSGHKTRVSSSALQGLLTCLCSNMTLHRQSIFILVPVKLWDQLRESFGSSKIQKEVCARTPFSPGYSLAVTSSISRTWISISDSPSHPLFQFSHPYLNDIYWYIFALSLRFVFFKGTCNGS